MSGGVLNAAMLLGLLGAAVPVVIHLLNRRREPVIDWGAMQFLDLGRRARQKLRLTELLLMLARMALLALVALALARPFWMPAASADSAARGGLGADAPPRDVVIVLDGSASMERKAGGTTPRALAVTWARRFVARLRPGDSVAVLVAGDRVRPLIDPPSFDQGRVDAALAGITGSRGSSDLPAALTEAFRVLERTGNPGRDVIVLTDGQRSAWRPGEARRWALVRDLQRRLPVPPRVWSLALGAGLPSDTPNGAVGPLAVARALVTPGLPIAVTTTLTNAGPGPMSRTAELLADGRPVPGSAQAVGPIPAGGRAPLSFRTTLFAPGAHLLAVRLVGDDALPGDDEAAVPVTVTAALPVLLVDGRPGLEPLSGATDFLRAALAPTGDDTPQVRATVVSSTKLDAAALRGQSVVVLASVDRLAAAPTAALGRFLDAGGGLLIAPGDRTDPAFYNGLVWMPAKLGVPKGDPRARQAVAHPAPATFTGPVLSPFAEGDAPPLAEADLFAYHVLSPDTSASVSARLDTGDPWSVERPQGRGRALVLAAALDAAAGTLPVNPDFVPLVHEWVYHLAGGGRAPASSGPASPSRSISTRPPTPPARPCPSRPRAAPPSGRLSFARQAPRWSDSTPPARSSRVSTAWSLPDPRRIRVCHGRCRSRRNGPRVGPHLARARRGHPARAGLAPGLQNRRGAARRPASSPPNAAATPRTLGAGSSWSCWPGLCLEVYLTRRLVRIQGITAA